MEENAHTDEHSDTHGDTPEEADTMPTEAHDEESIVPAEVDELLERRETVLEWLRKLNGMAEEIRSDVHEKVLEDYRSRLDEVEEELSSHATALEETLEEKRSTVAEIEAEREEKAAILEEAEVRHAVGEFTGEEWEQLRRESEADLASLARRLDEERGRLARLQEVRDELVSLEEEEPEPPEDRAEPEPEPPEDRAAPEPEAAPERTSTFADGEPAAAPPPGESADGDEEDEASGDELDFLESLALDEPDALDSFAHLLDDDEEADSESSERGRSDGEGG